MAIGGRYHDDTHHFQTIHLQQEFDLINLDFPGLKQYSQTTSTINIHEVNLVSVNFVDS